MVAERPYKGMRPDTQRRVEGGFTRANYADWVRGFRARWSDRTLSIRPQTYRLLFKKAIGMKEPSPWPSMVRSSEGVEEKASEGTAHAETP